METTDRRLPRCPMRLLFTSIRSDPGSLYSGNQDPHKSLQPTAAPEGSEINHGIHRNTRKRESESTSPFRVLPCFRWLPVCDDLSCRGNIQMIDVADVSRGS